MKEEHVSEYIVSEWRTDFQDMEAEYDQVSKLTKDGLKD
jgi:hypothetical protein